MSDGSGTQQKGGQGYGVFGGVGPVMGGSAGGKDYSLASMLGQTHLNTGGDKGAEAKSRGDKLGGPVFSSKTQDMLEGSGMLPGGETGFREGAETSLNKARAGQDTDVSKADEDTRGFAAEGAHPESGGNAAKSDAGVPQPQQGGGKGGGPARTGKGASHFSREEKDMLRGQGLMSLMSGEGTPTAGAAHDVAAGQYTGGFGTPAEGAKSGSGTAAAKSGNAADEDTQLHGQGVFSRQAGDAPADAHAPAGLGQDDIITSGNAASGGAVATPQEVKKGFGADRKGSDPVLKGTGRLAEKEINMLHGQGIISKHSGDGRAASAPVGLGKDSILTSGNPQETRRAGERDELQEEQTEIPEEEFGKQPSAVDAAWNAAGKVADKAKGLLTGGNTEE